MERSNKQSNLACRRQIGLAPILRSNFGEPFLLENAVKTIPLTQGLVALVDDEDYPELSKHKWCAHLCRGIFYAVRSASETTIFMHREILNTPSGLETDHENGNGLDNRRINLRVATRKQNLQNRKPSTAGSSQFKGVGWHNKRKKWRARISINCKDIHIGFFDNEIQAAKARDKKALEIQKEFAYLNFKE